MGWFSIKHGKVTMTCIIRYIFWFFATLATVKRQLIWGHWSWIIVQIDYAIILIPFNLLFVIYNTDIKFLFHQDILNSIRPFAFQCNIISKTRGKLLLNIDIPNNVTVLEKPVVIRLNMYIIDIILIHYVVNNNPTSRLILIIILRLRLIIL